MDFNCVLGGLKMVTKSEGFKSPICFSVGICIHTGAHNEGREGGKECEAPMLKIQNFLMLHTLLKIKTGRGETNRVACLQWSSTLADHDREDNPIRVEGVKNALAS